MRPACGNSLQLAPAIAGYVTEKWDWHWVFLGMIPFAVLTGSVTYTRLGSLGKSAAANTLDTQADQTIWLACRIALGVGLLLAAISLLPLLWMLPVSVVAIAIFRKPLNQVFPGGVWVAKSGLGAALALKFLVVFSFFGTESYIPVLLKNSFSYTPFQAGSVLTGAALAWTAATWIYERIADRVPVKTVILLGCGFMLAGMCVLIVGMTILQQAYTGYLAWALCALGMGFAYPLTMVSAMSNTKEGSEGNTATGAGMVDALGFSFSAGIGGTILNVTATHQWPLQQSIQLIWLVMMTFLGLAIWVGVSRYGNTAEQHAGKA